MPPSASATAGAAALPRFSFLSVRDESAEPRLYSFQQSITTGYAADGGMILPAVIPLLSSSSLRDWQSLSYRQLVHRLLSCFISPAEIDSAELQRITERAYRRFQPAASRSAQHAQPAACSPYCDSSSAELSHTAISVSSLPLYLLNLWHGPSLSFKDIALQPLAALLAHFSSASPSDAASRSRLNIVVGTSGDTGSAAIEAAVGLPDTAIVVLYPSGRISRLQELQMITVVDDAVRVVAVDGSSDELDLPIKSVLDDAAFAAQHRLCSLNSINVARILLQTAHFFYSAFNAAPVTPLSLAGSGLPPVSFSIPSGAIGHLVAALLVRGLGLPVRRLCVATNCNSPMAAMLETGLYRPSARVVVTASNAMDVSRPYNIERLLFLIAAGDSRQKAQRVNHCLRALAAEGEFRLTEEERAELLRLGVCSVRISDDDTRATMRRVWDENGVVIDPHTAVGVAAAARLLQQREPNERIVCLSTAHPAKFPERVLEALKGRLAPDELRRLFADCGSENVARTVTLEDAPSRCLQWTKEQDWTQLLKELIDK